MSPFRRSPRMRFLAVCEARPPASPPSSTSPSSGSRRMVEPAATFSRAQRMTFLESPGLALSPSRLSPSRLLLNASPGVARSPPSALLHPMQRSPIDQRSPSSKAQGAVAAAIETSAAALVDTSIADALASLSGKAGDNHSREAPGNGAIDDGTSTAAAACVAAALENALALHVAR